MRQPRNNLIFLFKPTSVTVGIQRVRNKLGLEGLRYHDLRREGASRLFKKGYTIEEVAQVTCASKSKYFVASVYSTVST